MKEENNKPRILVGVTGCIGASNIISYLYTLSHLFEVQVIMTKDSQEFIPERIVRYFSKNVYTDLFQDDDFVPHVSLPSSNDAFVIIPASLNTISKIASGISDNLLTASVANWRKKLLICPNMNQNMWENEILQDKISYLKEKKHIFLNKKRQSYEVADKKVCTIESGLPTPDELAKEIVKFLNSN